MVVLLVLVLIGWCMTYWHIVVGGIALYAAARVFVALDSSYRVRHADRLRHKRARREIDRIATETSRAMFDAALAYGDIIETTATELDRR